ncbi:MAG: tRNA uridine-5-carboxymethylaminomethyl(34) synthesis enzyme MnmG [Pseudomonadota bacterium]
MSGETFDIIVIGGGHAGCEAAVAASKSGLKVLLISSSVHAVGDTSCNPAIGGIGKTHIVKEIDALNGLMPEAADYAAIHYRTLNKKKGKAVQATRVQIDKDLYREYVYNSIRNIPNISLKQDSVIDLITENEKIKGVITPHLKYYAPKVILTSGTFLGGVINIGTYRIKAGRFGDKTSLTLARFFENNQFKMSYLKTGTPARIDARSVDWKNIDMQSSETDVDFVSSRTKAIRNRQISCGITYTNEKTHQIIQDNIHLSSVYSGQVNGVGPRYCPSIEDKVYKFPEKEQHQIFVEPEGLKTYSLYPNGISTALPQKIQDQYLRSIKGFENVSIIRYGYAIEYLHIDPRELYHTLETRKIRGLYLAGQINGTTGYEEAAGQGIVAGINAALSFEQKEYVLSRANSYIGVMIDDLIRNGVDEPYRMFTSRSEFRTLLRTDNARLRVNIPYETLKEENLSLRRDYYYLKEILDTIILTSSKAKKLDLELPADGKVNNFYTLLANIQYSSSIKKYIDDAFPQFKNVIEMVVTDGEYQTYTQRLFKFQQDIKNIQNFDIPQGFNFEMISGISRETSDRLNILKPRSIHEIKNYQDITPAALMIVMKYFSGRPKNININW